MAKYVYKRHDVRAWLQRMRAQGVGTFLVTNSMYFYAEMLLVFAFGEDWRTLFDVCVVHAKKPAFFHSPTTGPPPFYELDAKTLAAGAATTQLKLGGLYVHGNAQLLTKVLEANWHTMRARGAASRNVVSVTSKPTAATTAAKKPTVIYFGDHLRSDIRAGKTHTSWISAAIIEELELHPRDSTTVYAFDASALKQKQKQQHQQQQQKEAAAASESKTAAATTIASIVPSKTKKSWEKAKEVYTTLAVTRRWGSFFRAASRKRKRATSVVNESSSSSSSSSSNSNKKGEEQEFESTFWSHYSRTHAGFAIQCVSDMLHLTVDSQIQLNGQNDLRHVSLAPAPVTDDDDDDAAAQPAKKRAKLT
jgi:hypothetical protein